MSANRVVLPAPHKNQVPILQSAARFKVVRAGRRFGKDRMALPAAIIGHGPRDAAGNPRWRGIAQGVDVAWVGPDFPQVRAIWREEIEPRFAGVGSIALHQQERRITIEGRGTLEFRSAENIESLRGRRLGGCVLNEAGFFDLEHALKEVILPALLDQGGWVIIISTPNAGADGHETADGKRTPSYFNILCEKIMAGDLGPEWQHWHYTTRDNPLLSPTEVDALYGQYDVDSPERAQELDAKLIVGGSGLAIPEWADDAHVARYDPPNNADWRWSGFGDWGYEKPGGLWLTSTGPERSLVRYEFYFRKRDPYDVGFSFGKQIMRFPRPEWLAVDTPAVSDGGPTILEELQRGMNDAVGRNRGVMPPVFINPPKGPGSRITKKLLLHEVLKYSRAPDGTIPPWALPRLQFHPDCVNLVRTLPRLPRDAKKPEDVDTNSEDHGYDGVTGWLMARTPHVERTRKQKRDPDVHPGFDEKGDRRERDALDQFYGRHEPIGPRWTRVPEGVG